MAMLKPVSFRFFVLTCRNPDSDFRRPLVEVLRHRFETWYVWLKRRPVVTGPDDIPVEMSFFEFLVFMRARARDATVPVYFNSTNALYPKITALLRLISPPGLWCMDMHDDLLYHYRGWKRLRVRVAVEILRRVSHLTVHAADTLRELFPESHHLGNASQVTPLERPAAQEGKVLILASVDDRFDFELMGRVARRRPDFVFEVVGQVLPFARARFEELLEAHSNVRHLGAYVNADLPTILARYAVTFAPYLTGVRQTRYIDPLRFYHCLNSGMEVVTTDIPQARALGYALHMVRDAEEFASIFAEGTRLKAPKAPHYAPITWDQRASALVEILRTCARGRGRK
jgi:hypothetical protein